MPFNHLHLPLFIFLSIFSISICADPDCVYTVYLKTGSIANGGTNSNITLTLYDTNRYGIRINNLAVWGGLMGKSYNYFEKGNIDIFSGRGPCLTANICAMNITINRIGLGYSWYCSSVEVSATGFRKQPAGRQFVVEQWLGEYPSVFSAIRDFCAPSGRKYNDHKSQFSVPSVV